jgi:hypothetical protein
MKELESMFVKPDGIDKRAVIRDLATRNGVMAKCISKATCHIDMAIEALTPCAESQHKTALSSIAAFVVNRIS